MTAAMGVAVFDINLKQLHSSTEIEISTNTIKSILASLKAASPMKENFSFTINLNNEDYVCYTYGKHGVTGLSKNRRFALYKTEDLIVIQFNSQDSPVSCFESAKKYALQLQSQGGVTTGFKGTTGHQVIKTSHIPAPL